MKRHKIDMSDERHILTCMITNSLYLAQIKEIFKNTFFESTYAKIISNWIWEYYDRVGQAPNKDIQDIYLRKKHEISDEDDYELIAEFLKSLSEYYETTKIHNIDYEVQKAEQYFKLRSLEQHVEKINKSLASRDVATAERHIAEYKRVEKPTGEGIDLFNDSIEIKRAYDFSEERLFKYPGVLGDALGYFCRGDFFAILAAVKRGKTFHLWELAKAASLKGLNAVFFSLEMTQRQMIRRAWQNYRGLPLKNCTLDIPRFEEEDDGFRIIQDPTEYKKLDLSIKDIKKAQGLYKIQGQGQIRLYSFPAGTCDITMLETTLANLEYYDNFVPDVIVVDYADIIRAGHRDHRHGLNEIWVKLRGWAQERNCMVATASQTSKQAFNRDAKMGDVAEDMRKLATVTKMMSLNQNKLEKAAGVLRIEPLLYRDGHVNGDQICVLEQRDIGRVYLDSRYKKDVLNYDDGDFGENLMD